MLLLPSGELILDADAEFVETDDQGIIVCRCGAQTALPPENPLSS